MASAWLVLSQLAPWASLLVLGLVAKILWGALLDVMGRSDPSHLMTTTRERLLLVRNRSTRSFLLLLLKLSQLLHLEHQVLLRCCFVHSLAEKHVHYLLLRWHFLGAQILLVILMAALMGWVASVWGASWTRRHLLLGHEARRWLGHLSMGSSCRLITSTRSATRACWRYLHVVWVINLLARWSTTILGVPQACPLTLLTALVSWGSLSRLEAIVYNEGRLVHIQVRRSVRVI